MTNEAEREQIARISDERVEEAAMRYIEQLRRGEGDSVTILCDDPEAETTDRRLAVVCNGGWTEWTDRRFYGESVLQCLARAITERTAIEHSSLAAPATLEADAIMAHHPDVEKLREALEPFAEIGGLLFARDLPDDTPMVALHGLNGTVGALTRGHFKGAHKAIYPDAESYRAALKDTDHGQA
jgi:class 3 adenylate cyclase